jgi:hypothetical protein
MPSISIRAPKLVCAAVFAALCFIGWATKATVAQDPSTEPAASPLPERDAKAPSLPLDVAGTKDETTKPSDPPSQSPPTPFDDVALPPPGPGVGALKVDLVMTTGDAANTAEDPEKAALAFVEKNQKLAESQLKSLKSEEATLKSRLQKVEAGIKRWDSLVGALKRSQEGIAVVTAVNPAGWKEAVVDREPEQPLSLEPVPSRGKSPIVPK